MAEQDGVEEDLWPRSGKLSWKRTIGMRVSLRLLIEGKDLIEEFPLQRTSREF